jgi:hypothetical protein
VKSFPDQRRPGLRVHLRRLRRLPPASRAVGKKMVAWALPKGDPPMRRADSASYTSRTLRGKEWPRGKATKNHDYREAEIKCRHRWSRMRLMRRRRREGPRVCGLSRGGSGIRTLGPSRKDPRFRPLIARNSLTTTPPHFRLGSIAYAPSDHRRGMDLGKAEFHPSIFNFAQRTR